MLCSFKRWISLVLVLVMVLSMLPVTVRAEGCTHGNWGHKLSGNSGYFAIDSTYHGITYYFSRVCVECGAVIMEQDPSQTYTKKEYHDIFYLDNFCLVCNYRPGSTHTHNYKPGTTTVSRVYADAAYHNVVTTVNNACSCGAAGTPTVSTVSEPHTFGQAVEVSPGNWQKTCTGCGGTCQAEAPVQPDVPETNPPETIPPETTPETQPEDTMPTEPHVHNYAFVYKIEAKHPHNSAVYCDCGAFIWKPQSAVGCCDCDGKHIWGYPVRLPDGSFKQNCTRCNASQTVTPTEGVKTYYRIIDIIKFRRSKATEYQEEHGIDSAACAIWKTIAEQATDKLMEGRFVGVNEALNTYGDIKGSLLGAFTEESWNEQQIELWKSLLTQMLQGQNNNEASLNTLELIDTLDNGCEYYKDALSTLVKFAGESASEDAQKIKTNIQRLETSITTMSEKIGEYKAAADMAEDAGDSTHQFVNAYTKLEELSEQYTEELKNTDTTDWTKDWKVLGIALNTFQVAMSGAVGAGEAAEHAKILSDLKSSAENIEILEQIRLTAKTAGNANLEAAAAELLEELETEAIHKLNTVVATATGFVEGCVEGAAEWAIKDIVMEGAMKLVGVSTKALDIIELGAKGLTTLVDWNGAYDAAQKLMTINHMEATTNILELLKEGDDPYMAELWGLLQAEGCIQAQAFLEAWEDGTGLSSEDLGIDDGGLFGKSELPEVLDELNSERNFYISALQLPLEKK